MEQSAEIAGAREAKFFYRNIKQEPDEDQSTPSSPLTGCPINLSKTYEDDEKKENKKEKSSLS